MFRAAVLFALMASPALATEPYCQIRAAKSESSGCCIYSGKKGIAYILTCAHGKDDKAGEKVILRFRRTKAWIEGKVTAIDHDLDLALIQAPAPVNCQFVPLADEAPSSGTVTIYGYGKREFIEHKTEVLGSMKTDPYKGATRTDFYRVEGTGRKGDSGAAVIARGKLVGVHVASLNIGHDGLFVPVDDVHEFLIESAGWQRE